MSRTSRRSASKMRSSPLSNSMVTHHQFLNDSLWVIPPIPPHISFLFCFCFCFCVDMAPLYETLVVDSVLESDQGLLHKLKKVGNSNGAVLGYLLWAWVKGLGGAVLDRDHRWDCGSLWCGVCFGVCLCVMGWFVEILRFGGRLL